MLYVTFAPCPIRYQQIVKYSYLLKHSYFEYLIVYYLMEGEVLQGSTNAYTILKHIGEGGFGKVFKCQVNDSEEVVAVKILKNMNIQDIKDELDMLDVIGQLNADQVHVVKLYEKFQHCGFTCLVFEMLDIDLFQYCQNKGSLDVNAIRPIAMQLLETLQALKSLGITHGDFKYDNIMLVNREDLPYRVKLIDFGLAFYTNKAKFGRVRQIIGFRSPEVSLGLPYTEAIDMWALGCLLAFLYLGYSLFPESCEHLLFRSMVEILGIPSERMLQKADTAENVDRKVFIDLLKKMLHLNGAERISPTEALHYFLYFELNVHVAHLPLEIPDLFLYLLVQMYQLKGLQGSGPGVIDRPAHIMARPSAHQPTGEISGVPVRLQHLQTINFPCTCG
uniref:Protein kinase domain-containing protein n=1 Tax=Gouania willdenowi TaxID=441366 RepID=A0A8C5DWD9_GOUWI